MSRTHRLLQVSRIAAALGLFVAAHAQALTITREFSASWYDPAHPGHGFMMEVVDNSAGKTLVVSWYTYDTQGRQLWLFGDGQVSGNQAHVTVYAPSGGSFGNTFNPSAIHNNVWGSLDVTFADCNHGSVSYQPTDHQFVAGQMPISRLTQMFNSSCSGGISDDQKSASSDQRLVQFMTNTGVALAAHGKVTLDTRAGRSQLSVEAEDLAAGSYGVSIAGVNRGTLNVVATASGSHGEIEYRSPVEAGTLLLDFDPSGQTIEIRQGSVVVLTTRLSSSGAASGGAGGSSTSGAPPSGNATYLLSVEPQGNDGPQLSAKLAQRSDRSEFSVELADLPTGAYVLRVDGVERGSINVTTVVGGSEGEIEFRAPVESGTAALNFDPRGKLVEALRNGAVAISGVFPTTPTSNSSSGGGSGGNGGTDDPPPSGGSISLSIALQSTGADSDAHGTSSYQSQAGEREFEVEAEDLPDGNYDVRVGGTVRGTLVEVSGRGKLKFRDPARSDALPMGFDPQNQLIEVSRNGTVYLRGTLR